MLWGCKTLVAPLSFRPVSPRQGVSRSCAGGKASPPSCSQPRLCSCKSKRLVPAAARPVPPQPLPAPQPQVKKIPFCLQCGGALNCPSVDPSADGAAPAAVLQKPPGAQFSWACAPQGGSWEVLLHPWNRGWGKRGTAGFTARAGGLGRSETQ